MTLAHPPSTDLPAPDVGVAAARADSILLENVSWELYEMLLRDRDAAGQHYKITYDRGRMSIMSPLPIHEAIKTLLGRMIEMADVERDVGITSFGSTTWRREDLLVALEADECYYVGREPAYDRNKPIDLTREPAPDLAVEVDITRHPLERLAVYATLGVGEVWRYNGQQVQFFLLDAAGRYGTRKFEEGDAVPDDGRCEPLRRHAFHVRRARDDQGLPRLATNPAPRNAGVRAPARQLLAHRLHQPLELRRRHAAAGRAGVAACARGRRWRPAAARSFCSTPPGEAP